MSDIEKLLAGLSPEKRRLLELKLKKKSGAGNAFPLSYAQQRLWFLYQLEPESTAYNIPAAVRLKGKLDRASLEKALQEIVRRHEILRTTFTTVNGKPMQVVAPESSLQVNFRDLSAEPQAEREKKLREILDKDTAVVFNLNKGPLLITNLIRLAEQEHVLHIVMHHIISDGWSVSVFVKEFTTLYLSYTQKRPSPLPKLAIQYADFAQWQKKRLDGEVKEKQLAYWKSKLGGSLPVLELPTDHPRPAVKSYRGHKRTISIPAETLRNLRQLSQQQGATMFMILLSAFYALLYRYSNQDDICVGTPIANRNRAETEALIGFFVNTLVLRADISEQPSFKELLGRVKETSLEAFTYQDLPFEMLVEELQPERSMSHTPLFQVMFVHQNATEGELKLPGLEIEALPLGNENAKFDLMLTVSELRDSLACSFEYDSDLFEESTIERMLQHYHILLNAAAENPDAPLTELNLLSEKEKELLLSEWLPEEKIFAPEKCIHEIFEEKAEKFPERIALTFEDKQITYREINAQANRLAHYLVKQGVKADQLVGLYSERLPHLIVAILGILKAGGAYLPIDPVYPPERVAFMLEDAGAKIILTQNSLKEHLQLDGQKAVLLDDDWPQIAEESTENPSLALSPENLIYVIYTSGSTGKPKGTLISHYNVLRLFQATDHWFKFNENDIWTLFHSYAFDFSVWEIWGALLYGGRLVIVPQLISRSPENFYKLLLKEKVTVLNQTPSAFRQLIHAEELIGQEPYDTDLRFIIFGGEALELNSLKPWLAKHGDAQPQLINMYGITETTVHVTYRPITMADVEAAKGSVIGEPIPDLKVYILDEHLKPKPIGIPGEIHVSGAGLARGYLKRAELTTAKFVPNPFSKNGNDRLYRTGDLGRYLQDGDIEYIGRIDSQIKIRGFRIELGEIETLLAKHEDIRECIVITAKDARGDNIIAAYVVAKQGRQPDTMDLRNHLREHLPEYMLPAAFILLDEFPLTPNGKIDRKALPDPLEQRMDLQREYVAPRTPAEELVAQIYSELLDVQQVGANDHFFDLGGHSLLATQLISRIRDSFKIELPLKIFFENPEVEQLARAIERLKMESEGLEEIPMLAVDRLQELPLSYAQQRLWFLDQFQKEDASYNIPAAFRVKGPLSLEILQKVIDEIARRHESLRTTFKTVDGKPRLNIAEKSSINIEHTNASSEQNKEAFIKEAIVKEARTPFKLESGPLMRVKVLQLAEQEFVVLLTQHHIISDGWSMGILMNEVAELYRAFRDGLPSPLPEPELQYVDFAAWQQKWLSGKTLESQLNYWKKKLGHGSPPLQLPTDKPRPATQTANGAHQAFSWNKQLSQNLARFSKQEDMTLFMTLLSAFMILLYKYSSQEDISVGTPIANRNRSQIENIIGFFVNTLVMRVDLSGNPTVRDLLKQIKDTALGAFAHQDLPFEKLVDTIHPQRDMSHTPLFQVMFILQNIPTQKRDVSDITMESLQVDNGLSQFDITLALSEEAEGITGSFEYNTDLFEAATIKRMSAHLQLILQEMIENPYKKISEISLISDEEIEQLIAEADKTRSELPDMAIHHLIEVQAESDARRIAVIDGDNQLTYGYLNKQANQLAAFLQSKEIGPGGRVGVSLSRSQNLIIALLGILKSGAAYVPLDSNYPKERLQYMIEDADVSFLITEEQFQASLPAASLPLLLMDKDSSWEQITEFRAQKVDGAFPAYIIYTSGSTGLPKGVVVSHRSVVNHNLSVAKEFALTADDRVLQFATINFDAAGEEIYPALQTGAALVLRGNEVLLSGEQLMTLAEKHQITVFDLPTAYWQQLLAELKQLNKPVPPSLRLLVLGGDKLSPERYAEWLKIGGDKVRVLNTYGPTETTIVSTLFECPQNAAALADLGEIPIGKAIANTSVYVLDKNLKPVPSGFPGELHVGGLGLAYGYHNRPDLTAERFIPNPYTKNPGERLYKTGDLVRQRPDGMLDFLGRVDHQVKIRGFRVEIGEIEHALLENESIKDAAVIITEKGAAGKRLAAYLVFADDEKADMAELRGKLKEKLPEYMLPSAFIKMTELPYLPSGKIDRRALPEPEESQMELKTKYVAPRTDKEKILARIWQDLLGVKQIGLDDNFFDLGGDSIVSIQAIARAKQEGLQITPVQIFQHQTIGQLAAVTTEAELISAEQGLVSGVVPLTPIQHWFFEERFKKPQHWNQSLLLEVSQALHPDALKKVTHALLAHHDVFRLRYSGKDTIQQTQELMPDRIPFYYENLAEMSPEDQRKAIEEKSAQFQTSFDLNEGVLLRVVYFDLGKEAQRILIIAHHLAMDGVSWRILLEDLQSAYQQAVQGAEIQLPPKTTSFKEWSEKLQEYANSEKATQELAYWSAISEKRLPVIKADYENGENLEEFGAGVADSLSVQETKALLHDVPAVYNTEINDILLTALTRAFARWNGKRSLLINMEGHGREEIIENVDISRTVGWFTSLYPVYLNLENAASEADSIKTIKEQIRRIPSNGVGYGILRYLSADRDLRERLAGLDHAPITFNYLGQFDQALPKESVFKPAKERKGPERDAQEERSSLIDITCAVTAGKLNISFTYSKQLFREENMKNFSSAFADEIRSLIKHCQTGEAGGVTASDFQLANLDNKKLDKVLGQLKKGKKRRK